MEIRFDTMRMHRVFTSKGTVMFENREAAEEYVSMMKEKGGGEWARLNVYTWETKIEK